MTTIEFEKIYEEAYRAVYWTAVSLLKNETDAEDVVQDSFVTLLESYDTLQDKTKVVPWLKKICANKCLNLLSRTKAEQVEQEFFDNIESVPEDFLPESIVESKEKRKIIMDIIGKALSEDVRRTIILFYFDEMSTKEIAEAMGIPQGTVLWRLGFARKKIKKEVERYEKETDTKLYSVALPFLALLFRKEAEQVVIPPMSASLAELSASKEAALSGAGKSIASKAIRKGTGIVMKKLLIGFVGLLAVGLTITGIMLMTNREDDSNRSKKAKEGKNNTVSEKDKDPDAYIPDDDGPGGYGSDTEPEPVPTIDVANYDWESVYRWEGNEIVGLNDPLDEALINTGVLVIPARCETIGERAFGTRKWVKEVRFEKPGNVVMIGNAALMEFPQMHSFVMPPNANLFQQETFFRDGMDPFGNNHRLSSATKLHNLVLPNGMVSFYLMENPANYFADIPKQNQIYLDTLFVPENFSICYSGSDDDHRRFAKYTKEYYEANWSRYKSIMESKVFGYKVCKVYVVKGSWADVNFDDWTDGDLIQKEYWDGVNYTFAEFDPLWEVDDIRVYIGKAYTIFRCAEDSWAVTSYNEEREKTFEGTISPEDFEALYYEAMALLESGKGEEVQFGENYVGIFRFGDIGDTKVEVGDISILQGLIEKYAK